MASARESAAKKVAPTLALGSKEDLVRVLMETLVDPVLPFRVSKDAPSEDDQKSVAKQMHAVVLLYNYYHRKQNPKLLFLGFVSFCKLAVALRPSLAAFIKLMRESESMVLNIAEDQFSVTEKAIKNACDIAAALDASRDVPDIEGWPISKVVVLLIDSKKENCMLEFGVVTQGVWSPFEKELNESNINPEISAAKKAGNKRKRNNQKESTYDTEFLQLGYDAVKNMAGFESLELEVLETHVTYSLSKERTAARVYLMQCPGTFKVNNEVPLMFLVESLQGPLAEKLDHGNWRTTDVVDYFHMLPYVEFISCWLSRKVLFLPSLGGCNAQSTMNNAEKELTESRTPILPVSKYNADDLDCIDDDSSGAKVNSSDKIADEDFDGNNKKHKHSSSSKLATPADIFHNTAKGGNITDKLNEKGDILKSGKKGSSRIREILARKAKQHYKGSSSAPSRDLSQMRVKDDKATEKLNRRCIVADSAVKEASRVSPEIPDNENDDQQRGLVSGPSSGHPREAGIDENVIKKSNKDCEVLNSAKNEESRVYLEILDKESDEYQKGSLSGPSRGLQTMSTSDLSKTCPNSEDKNKKLNSKITVSHQMTKNNSPTQDVANVQENVVNMKEDKVDVLELHHTEHRDEKASGDEGDIILSCNQNCIAPTGNKPVQFEVKTKYNLEIPTSEELQLALALLYRKREELYSQMCHIEDTFALYEDNIKRIRDGGDVGLARQCTKSIMNGNSHLPLEHRTQIQDKSQRLGEDNCKSQNEKQTSLSEAYFPGKSSSQDLEYMCVKNDWNLPRYLVESSDGKFISDVIVEGKDFKLSSKGGFESNPCEARESAAAQMIAKIQSIVHNQAD